LGLADGGAGQEVADVLIAGLAMTQGPVVLSGQKHQGPFG